MHGARVPVAPTCSASTSWRQTTSSAITFTQHCATMSTPPPIAEAAAISAPQIHLLIAAEADEKKEEAAAGESVEKPASNGKTTSTAVSTVPAIVTNPALTKPAVVIPITPRTHAVGSINPFLATVPVTAQVTRKHPFILKDQDGNEKSFGSALGLLTRKFVNLIHVRTVLQLNISLLSLKTNRAENKRMNYSLARKIILLSSFRPLKVERLT
jgi:hypothetical protein